MATTKTVLNCPRRGIGVSRVLLMSGINRLRASSCGPVDAVENARANVIVLNWGVSIKHTGAVLE